MEKHVLDTSVINALVDGRIERTDLPGGDFVVTHVQVAELARTADEDRRIKLMLMLAMLGTELASTNSCTLGEWRVGLTRLSDEEGSTLLNSLRKALDQKNKSKRNNLRDALIAQVAIQNTHTLLTRDRDQAEVTTQHGGRAILMTEPVVAEGCSNTSSATRFFQ